MAAPTAPTILTIVAEGLRKAGYNSPTTALTARASGEWIEEVKADIKTYCEGQGLWLNTLIADASGTTVAASGTYSLPSDFDKEIYVRLSGYEKPLTRMTSNEYLTSLSSTSQARPTQYVIKQNEGTRQLYLWPVPDAVYTYTIDYYADLTLIDLESAMLTSLFRHWRNLWIQGIKAKCWEWMDDNRQTSGSQDYWSLIKSLVGRDSAIQQYPLQCTVEDYS